MFTVIDIKNVVKCGMSTHVHFAQRPSYQPFCHQMVLPSDECISHGNINRYACYQRQITSLVFKYISMVQ